MKRTIAENSPAVSDVPESPGVYIFTSENGEFLYVGKAVSLRSRIRTYLNAGTITTPKIQEMLRNAVKFDYLMTSSNNEALILENTLIKQHKPKYNTRLRDDKTYPYIKIDLNDDFPMVQFTRRVVDDGARYFGPYADSRSVRRTLDLLNRLFPFRSCTKQISQHDERPCLDYYLHRCVGPCAGLATKIEYREIINQVLLFLEGKTHRVVQMLSARMDEAAGSLEFERAGQLRDQIRSIQSVTEQQSVVQGALNDMDVIACVNQGGESLVQIFFVREGKLVGRDHFILEGTEGETINNVLGDFIQQFYDRASHIPSEIVTENPPAEVSLIVGWLSVKSGRKVQLRNPKGQSEKRLVAMVSENARHAAMLRLRSAHRKQSASNLSMKQIQDQLNLPRLPTRIECYDISNISGVDAVGSMVVYLSGKPSPREYRRFKIRTVPGIDDYSMMREMLRRRFKRIDPSDFANRVAITEQPVESGAQVQPWGNLPDLVLIDGGKGHLQVVQDVILNLGFSPETLPLASIAKSEEFIYVPDNSDPIRLDQNSPGLFLLQNIRDEAHRFAITYHRKLRSKRQTLSVLDGIAGVGLRRRQALLLRYGSVNGIKAASIDDLTSVKGISRKTAIAIKSHLGG